MTTDTRQQLYNRIRESSLDEVTLQEMIRHGFWRADDPVNNLPADMLKRRGELQKEISDLAAKQRAYQDPDRAIREIVKQRMAEAKARRIETKDRQAQDRHDRAMAWHEKKTSDIVHLGDDVSAALAQRESDPARLAAHGAPHFTDIAEIAQTMGISIGELRFLAYDRKASRVSHYKRFRIAKKTGGYRTLSAPMPRLKRAQYWLLDTVLEKIDCHDAAHGFRAGRSILTNAAPHQNSAVVLNFDLKDFFPSIGYKRVKGLFRSFGYAEAQAAVFALLATEADRAEVSLDGQTWHVANGQRALPQGAPTSPAITNLLCRKLDRRLTGLARKYNFAYTRYADDLTFSAATENPDATKALIWAVAKIVEDEGFALNDEKTRVMRRNGRQEVTGITVNDGLTVSRKERRKFRAHLHNTAQGKTTAPFRKGSPKASALGYAQFLEMVHGDSVAALTSQARKLHGAPDARPERQPSLRAAAALGQAPTDTWWKPEPAAPPKMERIAKPKITTAQPEQSLVPNTRRQDRPQGGYTQTRPQRRQSPPPEARPPSLRGVAMGWPAKLGLSFAAIAVLGPLPLGGLILGFVLYLLWWRKRQ